MIVHTLRPVHTHTIQTNDKNKTQQEQPMFCCCCVLLLLLCFYCFICAWTPGEGALSWIPRIASYGCQLLGPWLVGHNEKKPLAPKTPKLCFVMQ